MKRKWLGILLSLVLLAGLVPLAAIPASAADAFTIVGWQEEGEEGAVASVSVNGTALPASGGTITAQPNESLRLTITFNDGFMIGTWLDGIHARFAGVQSGSNNITNTDTMMITAPSVDWLAQDQELVLIISTAKEEPTGNKIEISVGPVVCGDTYGYGSPSPFSLPESESYQLMWGGWLVESPDGLLGFDMPGEGETFTYHGGETAYIGMHIIVNSPVTKSDITLNGGTICAFTTDIFQLGMVTVVAAIDVEHVPGEPVVTETAPTCEEAGSRVETLTCTVCGEEFSTETEEIPATGHDWGEWEVTREATATEAGERQRVCKNDPDHVETEEIPATGEEEPEETPAVTVTLTFDLGGGTLNGSSDPLVLEAEEGSEITIPDAPTREGYKFLYWEGSEYHPGDKYLVTAENHTFTAKWEATSIPGIPNTGDENHRALWGALMIGSALGIVLLAITGRKHAPKHHRAK